MPILYFQYTVLIFSVFAILSVFRLFQKKQIGKNGTLFWVLFWVGVSFFVMRPSDIQSIARAFGIGRGTDFVLYISVITLFYLVFRLHIKIEQVGRDVTKVVRKDALSKK